MRRLILLSVVGLIVACRPVGLNGDPFSAARRTDSTHFWDINWWTRLVTPSMLEFIPREPASPWVDADSKKIFVATKDGFVRSISMVDGTVKWAFSTKGPFNAGPIVHEKVVYVSCADGFLYAIDSSNGTLKWNYDAKEELLTAPVWAEGKLLVTGVSDAVYAVDAATGQWLWQYRRDAPSGFTVRGATRPTVLNDMAYVGFSDGFLVALSLADGAAIWERSLAKASQKFRDVDASAIFDDKGHVFTASYATGVAALSAETGDLVWSNSSLGVTSIQWHRETILASGDDFVASISPENGRVLWSQAMAGRLAGNVLSTPQFAAVPTQDALVLLDPRTGNKLMHWNPGKGVTATPALSGNHIYVLSNLGTLFDLHLQEAKE